MNARLAVVAALLLPSVALGQAVELPEPCTMEHVALVGEPAQCSGVLLPAIDSLDGATCIDADLPACRKLRARDSAASARRLALVSVDARDCEARAARWKALAMAPAPVLPPRVVTRARGVPSWVAWGLLGVGVLAGTLAGWKVRGWLGD